MSIHCIGFFVNNMEIMVEFYRDIIGLKQAGMVKEMHILNLIVAKKSSWRKNSIIAKNWEENNKI